MNLVERSGRLTMAQERWWLRLYWREQGEYDIAWSKTWDFPPGITTGAAIAALETLVARHETLRTAYVLGPDGLPAQVVFAPSAFRLPVSVVAGKHRSEFEQAGIHPLFGGSSVVRPLWDARMFTGGDGYVRSLVFVFEHIVTDGSGLHNLRRQFLDLCAGVETPLRISHPLDRQAREKATADAERGPDPTGRVPHVLVPPGLREPAGDRFLMCSVVYDGLLPVVDTICRSHRVSRTMVLMHAVGWLFARYSRQPSVLCSSTIGNRLPGDDSIDCVAHSMEILLELDPAATLGESLTAVSVATLRAYTEEVRFGSRPTEDRTLLAERRGIGEVRPLHFNYQGPSQPAGDATKPTGQRVHTRRTDAWRRVEQPWLNVVWMNVDDATEEGGEERLVVDFDVDTAMFSAATVHAMADLLPRFVHLLAERPEIPLAEADALLPPDFATETDCVVAGGTWVDPRAVEQVMAQTPGVRTARAAIEDGELVADLHLAPGHTPYDVHEHVLTVLHHRVDVVAPRRYRVNGEDGAVEWSPDGGLPRLDPETEAERELCTAFEVMHGRPVPGLAHTYAGAGGRALLAPAVIESLRRRGLTGLRMEHFTTPYSLRRIAAALHRAPAP